jgi:hypothetical protein
MRALAPIKCDAKTLALTPNNSLNDNANPTTSSHMRSPTSPERTETGYKDIRIAPISLVSHARDTGGNSVVMSVSPDTFTEVTE